MDEYPDWWDWDALTETAIDAHVAVVHPCNATFVDAPDDDAVTGLSLVVRGPHRHHRNAGDLYNQMITLSYWGAFTVAMRLIENIPAEFKAEFMGRVIASQMRDATSADGIEDMVEQWKQEGN